MAYTRTADTGDHVLPVDSSTPVTHTRLNYLVNNLWYLGDEDGGAPIVKASRTSTFTVVNNTLHTIQFNTEESFHDPRELHSTITNPSRLRLGEAENLGLWVVVANVRMQTNGSSATRGECLLQISKNGSTSDIYGRTRVSLNGQFDVDGSSTCGYLNVVGLVAITNTTDYVEIMLQQIMTVTMTFGGSHDQCNVAAWQVMGWQ